MKGIRHVAVAALLGLGMVSAAQAHVFVGVGVEMPAVPVAPVVPALPVTALPVYAPPPPVYYRLRPCTRRPAWSATGGIRTAGGRTATMATATAIEAGAQVAAQDSSHAHFSLIHGLYDELHGKRRLIEDSPNIHVERSIMKTLIQTAAVAVLLTLPVASFAQTNAPVTRAEVQAQLEQLERAGYNPAADKAHYPANRQVAQARIDAENAGAYGGVANGTSQSGVVLHPQYDIELKSIYVGH